MSCSLAAGALFCCTDVDGDGDGNEIKLDMDLENLYYIFTVNRKVKRLELSKEVVTEMHN